MPTKKVHHQCGAGPLGRATDTEVHAKQPFSQNTQKISRGLYTLSFTFRQSFYWTFLQADSSASQIRRCNRRNLSHDHTETNLLPVPPTPHMLPIILLHISVALSSMTGQTHKHAPNWRSYLVGVHTLRQVLEYKGAVNNSGHELLAHLPNA